MKALLIWTLLFIGGVASAQSSVVLHRSIAYPTDSSTLSLWQSQSVKTLQVSPAPTDRAVVLSGVTGGFEQGITQEPSVFWNPTASNWGMIYAGNTAVGYATASNPQGPWTRQGQVLGGGTGGFTGNVTHARALVIGTTIYVTFPDQSNNEFRITSATLPAAGAAPVFSTNSVVFAPNTSELGIVSGNLGNSKILLVGSTYYLFWEALISSNGYQMGVAVGSSLSGTYTMQAFPLPTLWSAYRTSVDGYPQDIPGGPMPFYENGTFVLYYHTGGEAITTDIYRATSTDAVNWTIDNNGQPWLNRQLPQEVSQVGDINLAEGPAGDYYAFWTATNNVAATAGAASSTNIVYSPVIEPIYRWESATNQWVPLLAIPKTTPQEFNFLGAEYDAAVTINNHELAVFDPNSAGGSLTPTLPYADVGARAKVCNGSTTGAYAVTATAQSGDTIIAAAPALANGKCALFYSLKENYWLWQ